MAAAHSTHHSLHSFVVAGSSLSRASVFQLFLDNLSYLYLPSPSTHSTNRKSQVLRCSHLRLPVSSRPPAQEEEQKKQLRSLPHSLPIWLHHHHQGSRTSIITLPYQFLPTQSLLHPHNSSLLPSHQYSIVHQLSLSSFTAYIESTSYTLYQSIPYCSKT